VAFNSPGVTPAGAAARAGGCRASGRSRRSSRVDIALQLTCARRESIPTCATYSLLTCNTANVERSPLDAPYPDPPPAFPPARSGRECLEHQRILRKQLLHPLHIQHGADRVHQSCNSVGCERFLQVERLQKTLFQFLRLAGLSWAKKSYCWSPDAKSFRFQRRNLQRVFQRYSISSTLIRREYSPDRKAH